MLRFCFFWQEFRPVLSVTSNLVTSTYCQNAAATDFLVWLHQSVSFTHTFIFFKSPLNKDRHGSEMKKTSWQLFHLADISHTQFIICLEGDSGIELKAEDVIIIMLCTMAADELTLIITSQKTGCKNKYFFVWLKVCHKSSWNNLSWPGLPWPAPTLWLLCVQHYGPSPYPIKSAGTLQSRFIFIPYLSYL